MGHAHNASLEGVLASGRERDILYRVTGLCGGELEEVDYQQAAVRAANGVPELRRRIRGDQVVEYDRCPSSHTVALPDGTYCYCRLEVWENMWHVFQMAPAKKSAAAMESMAHFLLEVL